MLRKSKKRTRRQLGRLIQLVTIGILVMSIFAVSAFLLWAATIRIPDFSLFETRKVSQSTKLYDRTGKILLYELGSQDSPVEDTMVEGFEAYDNNENGLIDYIEWMVPYLSNQTCSLGRALSQASVFPSASSSAALAPSSAA